MDEIWQPIELAPDYLISNFGRIKNKDGSIKKLSKNNKGYWIAGLRHNNRQVSKTLHTLVKLTFDGPRPEGYHAHHIDENKDNCRLDNLEWKLADLHNSEHSKSKRKLSAESYEEIRNSKESILILAERYGIHKSNISRIRNRKTCAT